LFSGAERLAPVRVTVWFSFSFPSMNGSYARRTGKLKAKGAVSTGSHGTDIANECHAVLALRFVDDDPEMVCSVM
jgi:hypothetical protein